ncbi:MAG TPA: FAD-dependent oxidoreductase [Xanthobacteraceae bacterium]|jgi:2-polyprenyl-6-methoxyphenol hydroxylase-like FAD-dependent oxidoreductase|nr:FAD-dependent oxidoreductase [Xanthobacteraceae bacterium]
MKTPVLIVGGGPVGLAMAGDLGWRGIPCVLIEKTDGRITQPRMDMVHVRTMEFCRRWGIVPWVEAAGYNRDYPQDNAWVTSLANGYELGREPFPSPREERPPPQSPQKRERCPQNFFDPVLARFAGMFPHVTRRYSTELVDFTEHPDSVTAQVIDHAAGASETIAADFLIACDGAAGPCRERLGIALAGNPVLTYTTNVIFRCAGLEKLHNMKPAYRFIFIGPEGTFATLVAIDGRDHWRFSLVGSRKYRKLSEAELRTAIERAVGCAFDFDIVSILPWTRRELVADRYGTNRVFLVGDSAHQLSPTGGFGMNTGIQEAVDLAWKLAARLSGWGGEALLASYELERRPIAARIVEEAAGNLARMLSTREDPPPPEIFQPGPAGDAARRAFGTKFTAIMRREWFTLGIQLGYRYENSPICVPDGSRAPPDDVATYVQTARPGHRAPHFWLAPERSTLDLFGRGFVLMRFGTAPADAAPLVKAAAERRIPLKVHDIRNEEAAALYERRLVLVRPDGHVAWRGDSAPGDAGLIMDTVRGASMVK